jgi:colanic acid/amylovoran biosynthesis glycosyltransferase
MDNLQPLRILIAGIQWPPETFLEKLIAGLSDVGVEVTVGSAQPPRLRKPNLQWVRMPSWNPRSALFWIHMVVMAARAGFVGRRALRWFLPHVRGVRGRHNQLRLWHRLLPFAGREWDLIYFPWCSAAVECLPVFTLPCPVVVSCRGVQVTVAPHSPTRQDLRNGLPVIFDRAAGVHCVSSSIFETACTQGLNPAKTRIIYPAVDLVRFCRPPTRLPNSEVLSLVMVGRLTWVKGHEWALLGIRSAIDRGIKLRLEIVGDGTERQRVLFTIADLGLANAVEMIGHLEPDELSRKLQSADAFLLTSHTEGMSNAALEAMACGLPIITTDCGGMREAVQDGVEGLVVPVRDTNAIAAAIERLARDPELRHRMGAAARQRVEKEFDLKHQIDLWVQFCRDTVATSGRSGGRPVGYDQGE